MDKRIQYVYNWIITWGFDMVNLKAKTQKTIDVNSPAVAVAGFKAVNNILEKWECTPEEKMKIMQLKRASYYKFSKDPELVRLTHDQLTRLSYILNIHKALRIVFSNPDNVYGFMRKKNHNAYFEGRTPLEIIATGDFGGLYEVTQRIDSLRSGQPA